MQPHQALTTNSTSPQLVVLTVNLSERLAAANAAHRALSAQGYSIVGQRLRQGSSKRPLLQLDHGDEELRKQLLHIVSGIGDNGPQVMGQFMDVDVCFPLLIKGGA